MVDIVSAYSGQGQEDSPHCGNCDERKPLKFYCSDCNCFLCEDCAGGHKKWKVLSGHNVKEIGNFKPSDAQDYARRLNVCKQHNDEVRFYCEQCVTCICRDCAILDHEDHKKISLEKGLEKKKSVLEAKMRDVQANRSRLKSHKESLAKRRLKVNNSFEQATKELQAVAERCINLIREHESSVTEQLINQKESFQAQFLSQMTNLDGKLTEIDNSLEFGEDVIFRNNLPEILNVEEMLEKRLQELSNNFEPMLNLTEVRYIPNDVSSLVNTTGKLFITNTEPSLSVAEGQGLTKAFRGEQGIFTVITKDSKSQTTYSEIDKINVEISSLTAMGTLRTSVTDLKNGHYQVMYTCDATGDYNVSITVGGEAIKGSPFRLTVAKNIKGFNIPVAKSVLQKKQEFQVGVLTVAKPYEQTMRKEDHNFEVFELVSAELCLETVQLLTREQTKVILEEIAGKTGIKWIEHSESFMMSGDFKQVEMSRIYLQQAVNQSNGIFVFTAELEGKQLHPQKREENNLHFGSEENEEMNQTSPGVDDIQDKEDGHREDPNETQSNQNASVSPPEMQCFEVEPKFIKVFIKAHKAEINDIEAKYHVEIPKETKEGKISLIPKEECSAEKYNKACDLFIALYQQMTQIIKMERFSLKNEKNAVPARKKIQEISKKFPVLFELGKDKRCWELYGEKHDLEEVLEFLEKEGIEIKREQKHDKRLSESPGSGYHAEAIDVDPPNFVTGVQSKDLLETFIGKVKVSVYKRDITSEQVDVIVNAANDRLQHVGGVAKAILDSVGKVIEKESNKIIEKRGPLKDGDAVHTNAGRLPCKKVVHTVGPEFRKVGMSQSRYVLRRACLNSLKVAQDLKMTSIALPAIGSGIYGMPKDACAEVMFDAVEEFVGQGNPKKKTITDIRFVNIDDLSVQAFRKEFISRYGKTQESKKPRGEEIKMPPAGSEGASSSAMSAPRPDRSKNNIASDKSPTAVNPTSYHYNSSFGASAAGMDHPLSVANHPYSQNASYSAAVKNNPGGTNRRSPASQEPRGAGTTGLSLPLGPMTYRKDEDSASGGAGSKAECPICLDTITNARALKCKHVFCSDCVEPALKHDNRCPVCKEAQGAIQGNQPKGTMYFHKTHQRLPGYHGCGTITINYSFPSGIQGHEHPNPGQRYDGTQRTAYLPDNREGNEVLQLLRRAFDARLVFTVGTSVTSGMQNQVTWNDIHHKTNVYGGPQM